MKKSFLKMLEQDFINYSKMADECGKDGNRESYNYWSGKAQGYKEVIELLELNVEITPEFEAGPASAIYWNSTTDYNLKK